MSIEHHSSVGMVHVTPYLTMRNIRSSSGSSLPTSRPSLESEKVNYPSYFAPSFIDATVKQSSANGCLDADDSQVFSSLSMTLVRNICIWRVQDIIRGAMLLGCNHIQAFLNLCLISIETFLDQCAIYSGRTPNFVQGLRIFLTPSPMFVPL